MTYLQGIPALYYISMQQNINVNPGGGCTPLTCPKTGYWFYYAMCDGTIASPNTQDSYIDVRFRRNYGDLEYQKHFIRNFGNIDIKARLGYMTLINGGDIFDIYQGTYYVSNGYMTHTQYLFFIPTPDYPTPT